MKVVTVPVKSLSEAKSRLSSALSPLERGALTLAMLEDVLDATRALAGWETWVVSPDEAVLEVAARRGARALAEDKPPLSSAIRQAEQEALDAGVETLAVLLADTPLITPEALLRALHTLGPVVLAPDDDELGTNLLVRRPPRVIRARFGSESFRKHLETAALADVPAAVVGSPELAFDLDVPSDILTLLRTHRQGRTRQVCLEMDLRARIRVHT
ncbi:MAG: 2-phospho-L-lactate guanylyltransferase [Actinobacteria bacterium]|nr:2-phospho-L-lactate guanylyltransferase [Actinomycetota bacterium]